MADPKDSDNSKFAQYKIADNFTFLDCYTANSIHSERVGYTLLTVRQYLTGGSTYDQWTSPGSTIKLPLPDTLIIPASANWEAKDEDRWGEALSKFVQKGRQTEGGLIGGNLQLEDVTQIAGSTLARYAAKKFFETQMGSALARTMGVAYNPNKQVYYEGPNFDIYNPQFTLMPRNQKEAAKMYLLCKAMIWATLPGAGNLAKDINHILNEISQAFSGKGGITGSIIDGVLGLMNEGSKYFGETPFFTYPNLWDFEIRIPGPKADNRDQYGYRTLFKWNNLAIIDTRINFDSNFKWHEDAYPTKVNLALQMKETQLRSKENLSETMPNIIV